MRLRVLGLVVITLTMAANTASAQDEPRIGITMGYPASIGVVWHVTDRIALRPEMSVSSSTNDLTATSTISVGGTTVTNSTTNSNDNWQLLAGASALFYLTRHENLRTYVSPRWAYTRVESTSSNTSSPGISDSAGNVQFVSGSLGAQYALGRRFSVFGEIGLGYTHTTSAPTNVSPASTLLTTSTTNTIATRSGAGVVLYF
jgi:hypothetical protein